jgi:hypothetical protein
MPRKPAKARRDKTGYGALALCALLIAIVALGTYEMNLTSITSALSRSDRARAQLQTGRMLVTGADRTQCRSIRFDNETAELRSETMVDCDARTGVEISGSLNIIRNSFVNH